MPGLTHPEGCADGRPVNTMRCVTPEGAVVAINPITEKQREILRALVGLTNEPAEASEPTTAGES